MNKFRRVVCGAAILGFMLVSSGCPWGYRDGDRWYDRGDTRSDRYDRDRDRDQDRDRDWTRDRDGDRDSGYPRRDR